MSPNEEIIVTTFIAKERRDRWRLLLGDPKRRGEALDKLNHLNDLDPARATWMKRHSDADAVALLQKEGSAATVYVMADSKMDGQTLPLADAVEKVGKTGWGAILLCTPDGSLGYHYGEEGATRALLKRPKAK